MMLFMPRPDPHGWRNRQDLSGPMQELANRVHGFRGARCQRFTRRTAEALVRRGVARWDDDGSALVPTQAPAFEVRNCHRHLVHRTHWINPNTGRCTALCGSTISHAVPTTADCLERCPGCLEA